MIVFNDPINFKSSISGFKLIFKLVILMSIISQNLYSQNSETNPDIVIENGFTFDKQSKSISWEKVFQIDSLVSRSEITTYFLNNSVIKIISENEIGVIGELIPALVNYKNLGYKWSSAPVIFNNDEITSNVLIQFKSGKYKITLSKIGFKDKEGIILPKGEISFINGTFSFREDGTIRTRNNTIFEILNRYFEDKFQIKKLKIKDW